MKILLAADDAAFSNAQTRFLLTNFYPEDTHIRIVHAVAPQSSAAAPQMSAGYAPELEEDIKKAREFADGIARQFSAGGFHAEIDVRAGEPRETICDLADEWGADLIVVGSHGRHGLRRLLIGSVAEFVVRHAHCSVLVVRAP